MTVEECYARLGGNYAEAVSRFRKDALIQKFALKFLNDKSYEELTAALDAENTEEAFRAAHTLKGVSANLSFTRLSTSASRVTEALRAGDLQRGLALFEEVHEDYEDTMAVLREFAQELC